MPTELPDCIPYEFLIRQDPFNYAGRIAEDAVITDNDPCENCTPSAGCSSCRLLVTATTF